MAQPLLDFDYAPAVWLIGPTDDLPFHAWLPRAVDDTLERFELPTGEGQVRDIVTEILTGYGTYEDIFANFVLHWPSALDQHTPVFCGLHERIETESVDAWLNGADLLTVEPPVIEDLPTEREGVTLRRSLPYSTDDAGEILVSARYVVDTGHPDVFVAARTAVFDPRQVLAIQDDIVALLSTVRVIEWESPGR